MGIGLFPPKRRVITEKFKKVKSLERGLYRLEMGFKRPESFLIDSMSQIFTTSVTEWVGGVLVPVRIEWTPITFRIIECEWPGNGERLSEWVNSHLFESERKQKAVSARIRRLYDDGSDSLELDLWNIHGCVPESVTDENGSIFVKFQINHGVLQH